MRSARFLPLLVALAACTPDPIILPVRNLERPADMGFACVERVTKDGKSFLTGRHMAACHDPAPLGANNVLEPNSLAARADHPKDPTTGQRVFGTFGLLTNTARGEVAVVHFPGPADNADGLVDLDPTAPGFNHIPVGGLPESISVADDSCQAVTANRSTCDLSVIDVSGVLAKSFSVEPATVLEDGTRTPPVSQVTVAGLRAQPREVVMLPAAERPPTGAAALALQCSNSATHEVVVTFPGCSLVAIVEVPSGKQLFEARGQVLAARIKSSVRIRPDGSVEDAGANPTCAIKECGFDVPDAGPAPVDAAAPPLEASAPEVTAPDAGDADASLTDGDAADGSAADAAPAEVSPVDAAVSVPRLPGLSGAISGLAVMPDTSALFVGLVDAPYVVRVGISGGPGQRTLVPLGDAGTLTLAEGAVGVTRLRLSVDPFAQPPLADQTVNNADKRWVGDKGRFLYAIARDGSARVIDVMTFHECDTNIDPFLIENMDRPACVRVGMHPRRLLADGPGVRVPATRDVDIAPAVPVDIAFAQVGSKATGFLLASNAQVYHVGLGGSGVEGQPLDNEQIHWFRRAPAQFDRSRAGTGPTAYVEPSRNFTSDPIERATGYGSTPFATKVSFPSRLAGPRLESYSTGTGTSKVDNWAFFPARMKALVPPESVSIEWQGAVNGFPRGSGRLEPQAGAPGTAGSLTDEGANFCRSGVEVGDVVTLVGCDQDLHCDPARDEICHRGAPGAPGVCVPRSLTMDEERVRLCRAEFTSRRRYEVREVSMRRLRLGLKLDEVPRPAVAPCDPSVASGSEKDVCQPPGTGHGADSRIPGDTGFVCQPYAGGPPRCVKPCGRPENGTMVPDDTRCRSGHVCAEGPGGFHCVEAPAPRPECLTGDMTYAVQVGNGYHVFVSGLPSFVKSVEDPEDSRRSCVRLPNQNPLLQDRISLNAPLCTTPPQPPTGMVSLGSITDSPLAPGNPCLYQAPDGEDASDETVHWKALFENPHFRVVLTNLEAYTGDAASIGMQVLDGFAPLRVLSTGGGSEIAFGERILTGPMASLPVEGSASTVPVPPYLFVIDQGRTNVDLSRGQLLRLNPRFWSRGREGGRLDSQNTDSRFPIQ